MPVPGVPAPLLHAAVGFGSRVGQPHAAVASRDYPEMSLFPGVGGCRSRLSSAICAAVQNWPPLEGFAAKERAACKHCLLQPASGAGTQAETIYLPVLPCYQVGEGKCRRGCVNPLLGACGGAERSRAAPRASRTLLDTQQGGQDRALPPQKNTETPGTHHGMKAGCAAQPDQGPQGL